MMVLLLGRAASASARGGAAVLGGVGKRAAAAAVAAAPEAPKAPTATKAPPACGLVGAARQRRIKAVLRSPEKELRLTSHAASARGASSAATAAAAAAAEATHAHAHAHAHADASIASVAGGFHLVVLDKVPWMRISNKSRRSDATAFLSEVLQALRAHGLGDAPLVQASVSCIALALPQSAGCPEAALGRLAVLRADLETRLGASVAHGEGDAALLRCTPRAGLGSAADHRLLECALFRALDGKGVPSHVMARAAHGVSLVLPRDMLQDAVSCVRGVTIR